MKNKVFFMLSLIIVSILFSSIHLSSAQDTISNKSCSSLNGTVHYPYSEKPRLYCNGTEIFASDGECCIGQLTVNPTQPCPQRDGIYCTDVSNSNNQCSDGLIEYGFYCSNSNMKCCYNQTKSSEEFFNQSDKWFNEQVNQIMQSLLIFIIIGAILGFFIRTGIQAIFFRMFTKKYNLPQGYWKAFLAVFFPALILNLLALPIILMKWGDGVLLFTWVLLFPLLIVSTKLVYKTETRIATFVALKYFALIIVLLLAATTLVTILGITPSSSQEPASFFINLKRILIG